MCVIWVGWVHATARRATNIIHSLTHSLTHSLLTHSHSHTHTYIHILFFSLIHKHAHTLSYTNTHSSSPFSSLSHTQDAKGRAYKGIADAFRRICAEEGPATLLSGVGPRVMWIGIGGFIFFGAYEDCRRVLTSKVGM
jgi:hypothetical protein